MLTSREVAVLDANAAALGVPRTRLMESSGNAVAREVRRVSDGTDTVLVVVGRGNNGGDGSVAARFLDDRPVRARLLGREATIGTEIARESWTALRNAETDATSAQGAGDLPLGWADVVVDAMLGTGVTGRLREPERSVAEAINDADVTVVSVDVPSGVDADTGEGQGVAVEADHVVTFHERRAGLAGWDDVTVADIGIPAAAERFVGPGDRLRLDRAVDAHKGDGGRVFVVGGGPYAGAPALAGQAALRAGADLAYLALPEPVAATVQGYSEDLVVEPYDGDRLVPDRVPALLERAADRDVLVVGPGLGEAAPTRAAVRELLAGFGGGAVIDADALSLVPEVETEARLLCTPHQGELREMGGPSAEDWERRAERVAGFAAELGHTVLVKGPYDVVTDGTETRVNRTGNPGMTVGGTGDVLAGVAGALFAGLDPVDAGAVAAYATGLAGDAVAEDAGYGLTASDLLGELPAAVWGDRR